MWVCLVLAGSSLKGKRLEGVERLGGHLPVLFSETWLHDVPHLLPDILSGSLRSLGSLSVLAFRSFDNKIVKG